MRSLTCLLGLALTLPDAECAIAARPNIIFILADDVGLDDVSCCGSDLHKTPQIDALAASGTRFETCYAAPLCGPSRCALMTGRYAFRTGGITNDSWESGRPGAKAADEYPMARLLKEAGYATCESGKWRQIRETPNAWGFDEYMTDPSDLGWYWKNSFIENGKTVKTDSVMYNPDQIQAYSLDFIRRNTTRPFFLYYAMHLVHRPTMHTPDSPPFDGHKRYDDNIKYMDKQVGELVAELQNLGLRENTLVMFAGDNGTAEGDPSPVHGRMLDGWKGTMLEGGSRVPLIASWPGVTPAGVVSKDIVNFTDMLATFAEIAGRQLPAGFTYDSRSIAPQLRGELGTPREWAFVQASEDWYVREQGWKLNEHDQLYDMSDAPFTEKLIGPGDWTAASEAARDRLHAVLLELNPAAGKIDNGPGGVD